MERLIASFEMSRNYIVTDCRPSARDFFVILLTLLAS